MKRFSKITSCLLAVIMLFCSCSDFSFVGLTDSRIDLESIPEFQNTPYVEINGNIPDFDESAVKDFIFENVWKKINDDIEKQLKLIHF